MLSQRVQGTCAEFRDPRSWPGRATSTNGQHLRQFAQGTSFRFVPPPHLSQCFLIAPLCLATTIQNRENSAGEASSGDSLWGWIRSVVVLGVFIYIEIWAAQMQLNIT